MKFQIKENSKLIIAKANTVQIELIANNSTIIVKQKCAFTFTCMNNDGYQTYAPLSNWSVDEETEISGNDYVAIVVLS